MFLCAIPRLSRKRTGQDVFVATKLFGFLLVKLSSFSLLRTSRSLQKVKSLKKQNLSPGDNHLTLDSAGERSDDLSGSHFSLSYMMLRGCNTIKKD